MLTPLVFIHGFKGCALRDASGSVRWLNFPQAIGLSSPQLSLPIEWIDDVQAQDTLTPGEPLDHIAWEPLYGPFLRWARALGRPFYTFSYDWRRDNLETLDSFLRWLQSISNSHNGARLQIVSHSMGGVVSFIAMRVRPDLVHSILFAGVPLRPTLSMLEDLHVGTANGYNRKILSPQVMFSFAAPYGFFPLDPSQSGLADAGGIGLRHDWYSPEDWERHRLGIFGLSDAGAVTHLQRQHLESALRRARLFRKQLELAAGKSLPYPPLAVLMGDQCPTLCQAIHRGPKAVRGWDFSTAPKEPGDGRVSIWSAQPPEGVPYRAYRTSFPHHTLLNDLKVVGTILQDLNGAQR